MSSRPRFSRARAVSARPLRPADRAAARARIAAVRGSFRRSAVSAGRRRLALAGVLAVERKFYDTALAATALTASTDASGGEFDPSATSMISTPAVGDSEQSRDGKRIVITSVQVSGRIDTPYLEANNIPQSPTRVFVALVLDTQSNGAQLNSEDVYKNLAGNVQTNTAPLRNLLFAQRFQVLATQVMDVTPQTLATSALNDFSHNGASRQFMFFKKLELPVNFNAGTTASIANVIDNSLHVIAYCSNLQTTPTISYNARIRFQG